MLLTVLFISLLWLLAAFLRWLFRDRLPRRLQTRWISIVGALSAFVFAEAELSREVSGALHIGFFVLLVLAVVMARIVHPRLRDHVINVTILLILLVPTVAYVYLRADLLLVLYYCLALIGGILVYLAFRSETGFGFSLSLFDLTEVEERTTETVT